MICIDKILEIFPGSQIIFNKDDFFSEKNHPASLRASLPGLGYYAISRKVELNQSSYVKSYYYDSKGEIRGIRVYNHLITSQRNGTNIKNRGKVNGFSYKSLKRFRERMFMIDWFKYSYCYFLTLTAPGGVSNDFRDEFFALVRKFGFVGVWRKDVGQKASHVHYHIMLTSDSMLGSITDVKSFAYKLKIFHFRKYYKKQDTKYNAGLWNNGLRIDTIKNELGVKIYVQKYCSKVFKDSAFLSEIPSSCRGRWWGVFGVLPFFDVDTFGSNIDEFNQIKKIKIDEYLEYAKKRKIPQNVVNQALYGFDSAKRFYISI